MFYINNIGKMSNNYLVTVRFIDNSLVYYFTTLLPGPTFYSHFCRACPINILSHCVITSHLLISCDTCFPFIFYRSFLFYPYGIVVFRMLLILLFLLPVPCFCTKFCVCILIKVIYYYYLRCMHLAPY